MIDPATLMAGANALGALGGGGSDPASVPDVFKPEFGGNLNFGDYYGGAATKAGNPPIVASVTNNPWAIGAVAVIGLAFIISASKRRK